MRALAGSAAAGIGVTVLSSLALSGGAAAQSLPTVTAPQVPKPPVQLPAPPQVQLPKDARPVPASAFERRVLVMRAGLGGRARSREATARRLGTTSRRVALAERSSVRRLRSAVRNGQCATASSVGTSISDAGLLAAVSPSSQTAQSKPAGQVEQSGVLGVSQSSSQTKDGEPILGAPAGSTSPAPADESGPIVLLWGIGALILGLGTVGLLRRRRMGHAGPLDIPASELPPAPWASRDDS